MDSTCSPIVNKPKPKVEPPKDDKAEGEKSEPGETGEGGEGGEGVCLSCDPYIVAVGVETKMEEGTSAPPPPPPPPAAAADATASAEGDDMELD